LFWASALQPFTGLLTDGTSVPMATVHFTAMTAALLRRLDGGVGRVAKRLCSYAGLGSQCR
jgi:hypothetical protein